MSAQFHCKINHEKLSSLLHWQPKAVADLHSKILDACPPLRAPNSFNFMQCLGKFGKIIGWDLLSPVVPPPPQNPGSADVIISMEHQIAYGNKYSVLLKILRSMVGAPTSGKSWIHFNFVHSK